MKVIYHTANSRLTFEAELPNVKVAFEFVAVIQEMFEEPVCGCCKSDRIRPDVREFDGNKYYKILCVVCGAQLDFGQHKVGSTLFVKRHDKDHGILPNGGWYIYDRKDYQ